MFRHVVLLQFTDQAGPDEPESIAEALRALPAKIPELRAYEVAVDAGLAETNAALAVVADFDDVEGYLVYRDHPEHRRIIDERISPILAHRLAAQFPR